MYYVLISIRNACQSNRPSFATYLDIIYKTFTAAEWLKYRTVLPVCSFRARALAGPRTRQ